MVTDLLSDFLTRIRNGYQAHLDYVEVRSSKLLSDVAKVLVEEEYLAKSSVEKGLLRVELKYSKKIPAITGIQRVSKSGARIYSGIKELPRVLGGLGTFVLSTPKGVISQKKAKKLNTGGEILLKIW